MKLNIGCGGDYREGYINIDFSNTRSDGEPIKVDLVHDVSKGLPYEDASVEEIVAHEFLEHQNRHQAVAFLKEFARVLKPGGLLDITVPPALKQMKMLMLAMQASKNVTWEDFEQAHQKFSVFKYVDDLCGATHVNSKGDSHLSVWSPSMLKMIIEHCGFSVQEITDDIFAKAYRNNGNEK